MCTIDRVNNNFDRVPNGNSNANGFHECGSVLWMYRERTEAEAAAIHTLVEKQDKGYDKYGQGIEHVDGYDWLAEAEEELADGMMYIAAAKLRRDENKKRLAIVLNDMTNIYSVMEGTEMGDRLFSMIDNLSRIEL